MLDSKGLSPVVATIALLLLTVSAAAFIAGLVVPLVKNRLSEGTECLGYEDYYTFYNEFEYNCYVEESGVRLYGISIQTAATREETAGNVDGFVLQFLSSGASDSIEVHDGDAVSGEFRMLNTSQTALDVPMSGEVRTYVYSTGALDSIAIRPLLANGRACEVTDTFDVRGAHCNPGVNLTLT